jgi:hypothetical protein
MEVHHRIQHNDTQYDLIQHKGLNFDTQHNNTQHNDIHHMGLNFDTQHNNIQHKELNFDTQHDDIQHKGLNSDTVHKRIIALSKSISVIMLSVAFSYCNAECHYAECR